MHMLQVCPRLREARGGLFQDALPSDDMKWSVRKLLEFSYVPAVNETFEGGWEKERGLHGHGNGTELGGYEDNPELGFSSGSEEEVYDG